VATSASFEEFFQTMVRPLIGQATVLTGDVSVAEDLAQEALARAWAHWDVVAGLERPDAWCRRVLDNLATDR
jgi:DNA-directed RNA polymerase specialized sigma24 family protein